MYIVCMYIVYIHKIATYVYVPRKLLVFTSKIACEVKLFASKWGSNKLVSQALENSIVKVYKSSTYKLH